MNTMCFNNKVDITIGVCKKITVINNFCQYIENIVTMNELLKNDLPELTEGEIESWSSLEITVFTKNRLDT